MGVEYIVSDIATLDGSRFVGKYDYVFMELGVLHYHFDLSICRYVLRSRT